MALLNDSWETSTLGRRKVLQGLLGMSAVLVGLVIAAPLGGMIKNPWKAGKLGIQGDGTLWTSGWTLTEKGVKLYLGRDTGALAVKHETDAGEHYSTQGVTRLVRMRPEDLAAAVGQEDFHFGDYYAYSKICTHIGCPTSLYEAQTNRILCPCHQSQFDALHYGKPVFGPAARALPQLPITVDEDGYLVAAGNFVEPVGPAFWERKS